MDIFLIIIGALLFLVCGWFALGTRLAIKDQKNWDELYKAIEEKNLAIPEEEVYRIISKMNFWFSFAAFSGLLILVGGILLVIF